MKTTKRLTAIIITVSMIISMLCTGAGAASYDAIADGDTVTVTGSDETTFAFIPEKDGLYLFSSDTDRYDPVGWITDEDGIEIAQNDDCDVYSLNFRTGGELKAGKTYYLSCRLLDGDSKATYEVSIKKVELAEKIWLEPVTGDGHCPGDYYTYLVRYYPEDSFCPPLEFSVDDSSVAVIEEFDNAACAVIYTGIGTTALRGAYKDKLSASITITCVAPAVIELDKTVTAKASKSGSKSSYTFTPATSDCYVFTAEARAELSIMDSDLNLIANTYRNAETSSLSAYLDAGEKYILSSNVYTEEDVFYDVSVSKAPLAENMTIVPSQENAYIVGRELEFYIETYPELCATGDLEWSIEGNDDIAEFYESRESCFITFTKEGSVTLTCTSALGFSDSVTVSVKDMESLKLDKPTTVVTNDELEETDSDVTFKFVPEESGYYAIYSEGEVDTYATLMQQYIIDMNDDFTGLNFAIQAYLEAGETYYLQCGHYGTWAENYTVTVTKAKKPESVTVMQNSGGIGYVGLTEYFNIYFGDATVSPEAYEVIIDDTSIAQLLYAGDHSFEVYFLSEGTVNISVITESGLISETVTTKVSVPVINTLRLDTPFTVYPKSYELSFFEFTPEESGYYVILSQGDGVDPYINITDYDFNSNYYDDDSGIGVNFRYEMYMEAGEVYRFLTSAYVNDTDTYESYSVTVTKSKECESVSIKGDSEIYFVTDELLGFDLIFEPLGSLDLIESIEIDNESVLYLTEHSNDWFMVYTQAAGTAKITVNTVSGYSATVTVHVTEGGEEPEFVLGDIDGDGTVNGRDANLLKRVLAGSYDIYDDPARVAAADIDGDTSISGKDSNILSRMIAGNV